MNDKNNQHEHPEAVRIQQFLTLMDEPLNEKQYRFLSQYLSHRKTPKQNTETPAGENDQ